ncbi:MAG: hypothetical protein ACMUIL_06765 [bacterium]
MRNRINPVDKGTVMTGPAEKASPDTATHSCISRIAPPIIPPGA